MGNGQQEIEQAVHYLLSRHEVIITIGMVQSSTIGTRSLLCTFHNGVLYPIAPTANKYQLFRRIKSKDTVRPEGFEPPTNQFEAGYSIQLSYGRSAGAAF